MAITSQNSVTIFIRTWTLMIIFCFASNAAGSCLSYGHSCWGGHGKRNGGQNDADSVTTKTISDIQQDVPSLTKEQWLLSRLIARPLMSTKYRGRWDQPFKIKSHFPQHWENGELNSHVNNAAPIRDQNNNEDQDGGKKRNIYGIEDLVDVEGINEEQKEIPEILLISNSGEHEQDRKPQNVALIKFLSDNLE